MTPDESAVWRHPAVIAIAVQHQRGAEAPQFRASYRVPCVATPDYALLDFVGTELIDFHVEEREEEEVCGQWQSLLPKLLFANSLVGQTFPDERCIFILDRSASDNIVDAVVRNPVHQFTGDSGNQA